MEVDLMIVRAKYLLLLALAVTVPKVVVADDVTSFMNRTPSVQEIVEALYDQPTRGIRPARSEETRAADFRVLFAFDSSALSLDARTILDRIGLALGQSALAPSAFMIEGHTDAVGSDGYNLGLSERRAAAVRDYLIKRHGLTPDRLAAVGRGEYDLLAGVAPDSADNRRVRLRNLGATARSN
jgi:outer membrane protein OmpA-like peptidoglycan-associated protein